MRRYRFSVVIAKLIEALYRRGYELDGSFRTRVREVNRISERDNTKAELMISYGTVGTAMREAIKIAFAAECYGFVSKNRARDHYAFNMSDFQSYVISKSKGGQVRGELIHVLHYYSLIDVPALQALVRTHAEKNADKPIQLKFLAGTPLSERRGVNALMPVEIKPKASQPDEPMDQAPDEDVQVIEVEEFTGPKPAPPMDPIIEDVTEAEPDTTNMGELMSKWWERSRKLNEWSLALRMLDVLLLSF